MPRLTVNTEEALSFDPVEPGIYECHIGEIGEPEEGPNSTFVWVYFEPDDKVVKQTAGRFRRSYPINGKGAGFFREFWKAATGEDLPIGEESIDVDTDDAIGRSVLVSVENGEFEEKVTNEVTKVVAAS